MKMVSSSSRDDGSKDGGEVAVRGVVVSLLTRAWQNNTAGQRDIAGLDSPLLFCLNGGQPRDGKSGRYFRMRCAY
jgi:hypothetical protein